jgi:hypothetical protein
MTLPACEDHTRCRSTIPWRKHDVTEIMYKIEAVWLVDYLEQSEFVVVKKPPIGGGAPPCRAPESVTRA